MMPQEHHEVRERIENREETLSPYALRSAAALRDRTETASPLRSEYQRDRDRILHSNAFRRLSHKAQVFVNPQGDHFATRMIHVLQVSQVGRTIARALNLNEDLVEAAALAHDVGHTPFGHIGERVLNEALDNGFHHSGQGVRTLTRLEKRGAGMNLTADVLEAVRRHSKPEGEFISRAMVKEMPLEAQIVRIADAVAYLAHDLRDALRADMIGNQDIPPVILEALGEQHSSQLNAMVQDIIYASWDCSGNAYSIASANATPWIRMSDAMRNITTSLRDFMFERVYHPTSVSEEGTRSAQIVELLFEHYCQHLDEVPEWMRVLSLEPEYAAADFICGMTDRYAMLKAERLRPGISENLFQGRIDI